MIHHIQLGSYKIDLIILFVILCFDEKIIGTRLALGGICVHPLIHTGIGNRAAVIIGLLPVQEAGCQLIQVLADTAGLIRRTEDDSSLLYFNGNNVNFGVAVASITQHLIIYLIGARIFGGGNGLVERSFFIQAVNHGTVLCAAAGDQFLFLTVVHQAEGCAALKFDFLLVCLRDGGNGGVPLLAADALTIIIEDVLHSFLLVGTGRAGFMMGQAVFTGNHGGEIVWCNMQITVRHTFKDVQRIFPPAAGEINVIQFLD